ncbi:hypothetical protein H0H87_007889 [Tephrocybe sp. NHM501043]|nr:hypothetical protein H0H87_007889 [Tephrocybe sp. NHM501043]
MSVGSSTNVSIVVSESSSERATSTSPSSVASDLPKDDIRLPSPFHPPSLAASQFTDIDTRPRKIDIALPSVPHDEACNRRKEQNVVQKSLGFSWGAGGLSTALFTGVRLADVLEHVKPARGAKHVVFEGSDRLPNGPYGTSAIACPDHGEILDVHSEGSYTLRGYAYAGGGRRVTRVELSFDEGESWELAEIQYPEDAFREVAFFDSVYGALDLTESDQCYCWSFWSLLVPLSLLRERSSICVRAMDESMALQPRNMYWNATGMMNNWWFRVCIHTLDDGRLQFEHPTMAGTQAGGWMTRLKDQGKDPSKPVFSAALLDLRETTTATPAVPQPVSMTRPGVDRKITVEEFRAHANSERPWFVISDKVYDATKYLNEHPGGPQSITLVAGEDVTDDFMAIHSSDAKRRLSEYHIGTLVGEITGQTTTSPDDSQDSVFLRTNKWKSITLQSMEDGSGITPILQVLRGIFTDTANNDTDVWVLDINRDVKDILCRDELDHLASAHGSRFSLRYSLTGKSIPDSWPHSVGRLDSKMLKTYLPTPSSDGLICLCGPPQTERLAKDHLEDMGWDASSQIVIF